MKKKALAALGAIMLAGGLSVALPTAASAATSCGGSHVKTLRVTNPSNGVVIGNLGVYKTSTRVCAVLMKSGPTYGVATDTYLRIYGAGKDLSDSGEFRYQTDALSVAKRPKDCVTIFASVRGKNQSVGSRYFSVC